MGEGPSYASPQKRSVMIAGHQTSISLEPLFWSALEAAARDRGCALNALVAEIDADRLGAPRPPNLTSAIRQWLFARTGAGVGEFDMAELNHTIVWCSDKERSAAFLTQILGLRAPRTFFHFLVVDLKNGVSLDYFQKEGSVAPQHYAFLVSDEEFDAAFARIEAAGLEYWADPARTQAGRINHHFGGRGVYFRDPDDHLLELITKPYGSEDEVS